jgi:paraquat-inducible protein B
MQELAKKIEKLPIQEIFDKLSSALDGINRVAQSPEIVEAFRSVNLAVADVRKLVQNVDNRIGPLASSIEGTVNDYGKLARNADKEVQKAVLGIEKTLGEAQLTLAQARQTLSEDSTLSYEIAETLQELQKGARSIRLLADDLKRRPESAIWGK